MVQYNDFTKYRIGENVMISAVMNYLNISSLKDMNSTNTKILLDQELFFRYEKMRDF